MVTCDINVIIDTHFTDLEDFFNTETLKVRLHLEASDPANSCLPAISIDLKPKDILRLYAKTLYYSVAMLLCLILSIVAVVKQLKKALQNF